MTTTSMVVPKFLKNGNELGVVAVGFSGGQCKPGVDAAPSALIENGLLTQLHEELGYDLCHDNTVHSYKELIPPSDPDYRNMKNPLAVSVVTQKLSDQVYNHAKEGRCVLTLGGDHSIAIGSVAGTAKAIRQRLGREIALIWVDAHADINTPESSDSGNIHGMPVAFLTRLAKEERKDIFGWIEDDMIVSVKKLVYIGLRDVDRGEKKILRENGIKAFSMHDIDKHGIGRVMELALGHIGNDTPIHLSFDVDALDPLWAPSTGTPVRGGLTLREGDFICECVHETGSLVAIDLVEVNPTLEVGVNDIGAHETVRAGCSLVRCALGESLLVEHRGTWSIEIEAWDGRRCTLGCQRAIDCHDDTSIARFPVTGSVGETPARARLGLHSGVNTWRYQVLLLYVRSDPGASGLGLESQDSTSNLGSHRGFFNSSALIVLYLCIAPSSASADPTRISRQFPRTSSLIPHLDLTRPGRRQDHCQNGLDRDYRVGSALGAREALPMAGSATELLAPDHDDRECDHDRHLCQFYHDTESNVPWRSLVLLLLDSRRHPLGLVYLPPTVSDLAKISPPRHRHPRLLHPVRPLARRPHRHLH